MNAIDFVEGLKNIPSEKNINKYKEDGLNNDFIREYLESYLFKSRGGPIVSNEDPIKDLVSNYDGASVALGMVTFDIEPKEGSEYFLFGRFEGDHMVINNRTGEIEQQEYGRVNHVLSKAAQNSSRFLDAMLEAAKFLDACGVDDDLYEDQDAINAVAEKCSQLAGGQDYIDFYRVLLGSDL